MVVTRSRLDTHKQPTKKKFTDDDFEEHVPITEKEEEPMESEPESDSDSDEAPEEESTTSSRKAIIEKQKQEQLQLQKAKEEAKEARRQLDLKNKQQQELKKQRELERKALESELPEFLPEDIFSSLEEEKNQAQGRHLKAQELDERSAKLARQRLKEEKLRRIKEAKTTSVKKGPIHVKVQSFDINKKIVPRAESRVIDTKESWLSRKSLNKK